MHTHGVQCKREVVLCKRLKFQVVKRTYDVNEMVHKSQIKNLLLRTEWKNLIILLVEEIHHNN
jgi:hypothetical protein